MITYVLDTDTTTLLLRGQMSVRQRVASVEAEQLAVTIITVEEILTGWYSQIRRSKKDDQVLRAYTGLQQAIEFLARIRILPMDLEGLELFHDLRSGKHRIGTNDLKIAAIVQRQGATLVTRNLRDFKRIPGMRLENWS
jgi:tRNA(fMet)-specific endonuclease VapC